MKAVQPTQSDNAVSSPPPHVAPPCPGCVVQCTNQGRSVVGTSSSPRTLHGEKPAQPPRCLHFPRKEECQRCSRAATTDKLRCQTNARKHPKAGHSFPSPIISTKRCREAPHPNPPTLTTLCTSTTPLPPAQPHSPEFLPHPKHPKLSKARPPP